MKPLPRPQVAASLIVNRPEWAKPDSGRPQIFAGKIVGVYSRISDDKYDLAEGVEHQRRDGERRAWALGAVGVIHFVENDKSAWKKKRIRVKDERDNSYLVYRVWRPVWQLRFLPALRSGEIFGAVVVDQDRMAREPRDLEDCIELAEHYGCPFESCDGSIDLNTPTGRTAARIKVAVSSQASADMSRRAKAHHAARQEDGIPMGGVRPFGYAEDKVTLVAAEAEAIRDAAKALLAGGKFSTIVSQWTAGGIKTSKGNSWTVSGFKAMMRNPRLAGLRGKSCYGLRDNGCEYHYYEIVRKPDGSEVAGTWDAILDRETWDALQSIVAVNSSKKLNSDGWTKVKYLLSGILRCGRCGGRMNGCAYLDRHNYNCPLNSKGGCGKVVRVGPPIDQMAIVFAHRMHDLAMAELRDGSDVHEVEEAWSGDARIEQIGTQLADIYKEWKAGRLLSHNYFPIRYDLEGELDVLQKEKARRVTAKAQESSAHVRLDEVRKDWANATLQSRREFISAYISSVIARPFPDGARRNRFDPSLIEINGH